MKINSLLNFLFQKSDVIPSIPKPKSSVSPKLGRSSTANETAKISNGAADLLGLDTSKPEQKPPASDDIFSSFFSSPQEKPVEPPKPDKPDLKKEEENFFNQPAPTEKEKSKLTKDSILALYSQTPNANLATQFPAQNQFQYGGFQQSFNSPMPNGMQQQFNQFPPMNSQFQGQGQQLTQPQPQGFQNSFPQGQVFGAPAQSSLQQQFGGLNLGPGFNSAFPQQNANVASNGTWQ